MNLKIDLSVLNIVKKHAALALPAGLTVGAVLLFVPAFMLSKSVTNSMQESISQAGQVSDLQSKAVSKGQYLKEQEYQKSHEKDANNVEKMAMQTSMRELLMYGLFPVPDSNETSSAIFTNFGKKYRAGIEGLITSMKARDCPTEDEIREFVRQASTVGGNTTGVNNDEKLVDQFCKDRASKIPVYANPEMLAGYSYWNEYNYIGMDKAVDDCWNSQLAYWVQKDVMDSITSMNGNSMSIFTSPVKRLIRISFLSEYKGDQPGMMNSSNSSQGVMDLPQMVGGTGQQGSSAPSNVSTLSVAWTGRVSGETMEVTHFAFSVIINAKSVLPFMEKVCSSKEHKFKGWRGEDPEVTYKHNQITILKTTIEPVVINATTGSMNADRYRYGDDAIVQLNLVCEYVFNKTGYSAVKPAAKTQTTQQ
jgi:hypothetical protein